ncbi:multiple sugar transport system permease protein [Allocatelliglobosispora scoriae]|uniref:Multiple sugar transport system permease protein n=1 Tax=Allocatelliglobosispora scoriae TaxID=643052 RepID=A0A841BTW9_9ACTN|nr:sugar ABC transporter permease [Allocatelliglobosispora scoriae]MBB5870220.1 multiple sugar transport system permease protein [Allocatelliglobosispora scoriae]
MASAVLKGGAGRIRRSLVTLTFIGPALLGLAIFLIYPLIAAIYFSFTRFDMFNPPVWVGLDFWKYVLFDDPTVRIAAKNTLVFVVLMVPARMVGALLTAMLLNAMKRSRSIYRTLFYLPALAPPVTATIAFVLLLKPGTGPVNTLLAKLGIEGPGWFNDPNWAKASLTLLALWGVGDLMIIFVAALLDVPQDLYEAASLDGANRWQKFRFVTLPTISPVLLFATITGVIGTLNYFTQAAVAGSVASGQVTSGSGIAGTFGYPENSTLTYPMRLYSIGFSNNLFGAANVMAVILFVVSMGATLILLRRFKAFTGGGR